MQTMSDPSDDIRPMTKRPNLWCLFLLCLTVFAGGPLVAQSPRGHVYPTTIVLPGRFDPVIQRALQERAEGTLFRGSGRRIDYYAERPLPADTTIRTPTVTHPGVVAAARSLIAAQFITSDFQWRYDTLAARAAYSTSFQEASREAERVSGPNLEAQRVLTSNFVFVVTSRTVDPLTVVLKVDTIKPAPKAKDQTIRYNRTYIATATLSVAAYRLRYDSPADVERELSPFYCDRCPDRARRQQEFLRYQVPLEAVDAWEVRAVGTAGGNGADSSATAAARAAASALQLEIPEEATSRIAAFKRPPSILIGVRPPAARVGTKEGLTHSDRFVATYQEERPDGSIGERRGAILLAKKVAENRGATFAKTTTTIEAQRFDSSTFHVVYPGRVELGAVLQPEPLDALVNLTYTSYDGLHTGIMAGVKTEALGLNGQVNLLYFPRMGTYVDPRYEETGRYSKAFVTAEMGYELYPLRGRFRLFPVAGAAMYWLSDGIDRNNSGYEPKEGDAAKLEENPLEAISFGYLYGADAGLRLTPRLELFGSWRQGRIYNDGPDASGRPQGVDAFAFSTTSYGLRLYFGI